MRNLLITQLSITLIPSIIIYGLMGSQPAKSYLYGSGLILLNLCAKKWLWSRIVKKKLIALTAIVIVIKYAIFGGIIYYLLKDQQTQVIWLLGGLSTLLISTLVLALVGDDKTE